jgi:hypothetical protein
VAPDELLLACRLSGLTLEELWLRYLEIGGSRSRSELASRLGGADWPTAEDRFLTVVAVEALQERGLPQLAPPHALRWPFPPAVVPVDDALPNHPGTVSPVPGTRAYGEKLSALFERCARARADARGVRRRAASARRAGPAHS